MKSIFLFLLFLFAILESPFCQTEKVPTRFSLELSGGVVSTYAKLFRWDECDVPCSKTGNYKQPYYGAQLSGKLSFQATERQALAFGANLSQLGHTDVVDFRGEAIQIHDFIDLVGIIGEHRLRLFEGNEFRFRVANAIQMDFPVYRDEGMKPFGFSYSGRLIWEYQWSAKWTAEVCGMFRTAFAGYGRQLWEDDFVRYGYGFTFGVQKKIFKKANP